MLTGLLNRKGFSQALDSETVRVSESRNLSLLMIDIDHFKKVNDTYGHLLGDKVIRFVGMTVKDRIKGKDLAACYGGEELAVLLPETSLAGARSVAEEIRRAMATARIQRLDNGQAIGAITVSLGVAQYRPGETHEALIARADAALYRSKESGRNRVSVEGD
jgi:diguanylate cyclase